MTYRPEDSAEARLIPPAAPRLGWRTSTIRASRSAREPTIRAISSDIPLSTTTSSQSGSVWACTDPIIPDTACSVR